VREWKKKGEELRVGRVFGRRIRHVFISRERGVDHNGQICCKGSNYKGPNWNYYNNDGQIQTIVATFVRLQ